MKTKRVRPVLVESKDIHSQLEIDSISIGKLSYEVKQYHCKHPQELILISLEDEKIEIGELVYKADTKSKIYKHIPTTNSWYKDEKKVIARQSQISPEYISKFIEQYNNDCVEDLEIEMEELYIYPDGTKSKISRLMPDAKPVEEPNLTNGFVTIVEKEYSYNLLSNMQYYMEYCQANGYVTPQDWLNKFKHYSDRKEPISYTEEEVKSLCSEAYSLGLSSLKSEIPDLEEMMELDNWFENNKKK